MSIFPRPFRSARPRSTLIAVLTVVAALLAALAATLLGACSSGPDYVRPSVGVPAAYKEAALPASAWTPARPASAGSGSPDSQTQDPAWWTVYGDAELDALVAQANRANQSLQAAAAQYRQARAATQVARSAYAPTVSATLSAGRARTQTATGPATASNRALALDASWEPDLWGRIGRSVEAGVATEQAGADDLDAARLSVQAELVQDYLQLRVTDALKALLDRSVDDDRRALALTRSQQGAGIATRADVALAETQLQSTLAQAIDLGVQRAQLEHAIATLTGQAPAALTIAVRPADAIGLRLPAVPVGLPSQLLERRPDIAAAERRAAAANAQIGVAQSAYFPSLAISASGGFSTAGMSPFFAAPSRVWGLGAALAGTLFDGGLRRAQSDSAIAAYDAAAADYKQAVLGGFQDVEDQLAALRVLAEERGAQDAAVASSRVALRVSLAQYRAGTATYLAVVTAQTLALSNERSAVSLVGRQWLASAALVKALGGGWNAGDPVQIPAAEDGTSATLGPDHAARTDPRPVAQAGPGLPATDPSPWR